MASVRLRVRVGPRRREAREQWRLAAGRRDGQRGPVAADAVPDARSGIECVGLGAKRSRSVERLLEERVGQRARRTPARTRRRRARRQ